MIPKIIHYCWFGEKPLPTLATKCISSWKRYMPEWEIIEWNESNFDVNYLRYTREAYDNKKYAFVADVARLQIIYECGGVYLDTDVEVLKSFEPLLYSPCFLGFQSETRGKYFVNTGLGFGAEKGNPIVKAMLNDYSNVPFILEDGGYDMVSCPVRNSKVLQNHGIILNGNSQKKDNVEVFSSEYFCPMDEVSGKIVNITNNTYSIHHFSGSWLDNKRLFKRSIRRIVGQRGINLYNMIKDKHHKK